MRNNVLNEDKQCVQHRNGNEIVYRRGRTDRSTIDEKDSSNVHASRLCTLCVCVHEPKLNGPNSAHNTMHNTKPIVKHITIAVIGTHKIELRVLFNVGDELMMYR